MAIPNNGSHYELKPNEKHNDNYYNNKDTIF